MTSRSPYDYYEQITLTSANKSLLNKIIVDESIEEYFHSIEIRLNDKLLFNGYDGVAYGMISKTLPLTDSFKKNFIDHQMCTVSEEW